ncbi:preprotein translocase subunit SecY [Patescibacteria group bacterium]|nr:preprotein translocase subunit SecY [Patescibacteria group bacterium]
MWEKLLRAWQVKEVRHGLLFVIAMMVIFRVVAHIPLPGINLVALQQFFDANQVLGVLNLFSGGTIRTFSIIALGVAPYITASIILQLLAVIIPRLEEIQKDGESGQRKINQWTRLLTIPLAIIQAVGLLSLMRQSQVPILTNSDPLHIATILLAVTAGTMFLMWIGELMSEKKVGNGISLIIFAGILADLPNSLGQFITTFDSSQWMIVIVYAIIAVLMVAGVVFVTEGQRNIPIQHARNVRGQSLSMGGVASSLPLRVNMVGVMPIIFGISFLTFPSMLAQLFSQASNPTLRQIAAWILTTIQNQTIYGILYLILVVGFTYFYTAVVFHPERVAENLQKQGAFIPGIRPGPPTAQYLEGIVNRMTLAGAVFLGLIAVLPIVAQAFTGTQTLTIGGTSVLIVVSVVIESVKQIQSQSTMREYDNY